MRLALALSLFLSAPLAAQQALEKTVAVTFDDVPGVAMSDWTTSAAIALNQRLLASIKRNRMPAAALVVTGPRGGGGSELTRIVNMWLDDGHEVGSHSHMHRDINNTPLAMYLRDVDLAHNRLNTILEPRGKTVRYFRHPGLHAGNTAAKKVGLDRHLAAKGYRIAVVTVDNQEWVYAEAYAAAKARNDSALIRRILPAYYAHIDSSFAYYEALTEEVFKRRIPQVLLLHANEINADHLDDVARIIRRRGYRFVSLDAAMSDPAYRRSDTYIGPVGMSWLQRWARADGISFKQEPREAAWLK